MTIKSTILTLIISILGPVICYIVVYGSISLIKFLIILFKSIRFKHKMARVRSAMDEDELSDIEVETYTSEDIRNNI